MTRSECGDLRDWLDGVRSEYWDGLSASAVGGEVEGTPHVFFRVGDRTFAIDARFCKAVVRKPPITRLPGLPPHVLGVAGIRGEVVSTTDPAALLRVTGHRPDAAGYLLVLSSGGVRAAVWVDRVDEVVQLDRQEVVPLESSWPGVPEGVLTGQLVERDPPVFILNGPRYLEESAVGDPPRR